MHIVGGVSSYTLFQRIEYISLGFAIFSFKVIPYGYFLFKKERLAFKKLEGHVMARNI